MELILLVIIALLAVASLLLLLTRKGQNGNKETQTTLLKFGQLLVQLDKQMKDDFQRNREESQSAFRQQREELAKSLTQIGRAHV